MLRHTKRAPDEVVATIAPGMGAATVECIAIQGVMAGCYPEYLPVLIAAAEVKRRLWDASKMRAGRHKGSEFDRIVTARRAEPGGIGPDTMLPISEKPDDLSIVVAGGPGSHSVFMPVSAYTRSVTREIVRSE